MENVVVPVSFQLINWDFINRELKSERLRILDKLRINRQDPTSILFVINDDEEIDDALLEFITFGFIVTSAPFVFDSIIRKNLGLKILLIEDEQLYRKFFIFGDALQWKLAFKRFCKKQHASLVRDVFCKALNELERTKLKQIYKFKKTELNDSTYEITTSQP